MRLWDVASGEIVADLHGLHGDLVAVAFSADGTRLATGGVDPALLVWNLATLRHRRAQTLRCQAIWRRASPASRSHPMAAG